MFICGEASNQEEILIRAVQFNKSSPKSVVIRMYRDDSRHSQPILLVDDTNNFAYRRLKKL